MLVHDLSMSLNCLYNFITLKEGVCMSDSDRENLIKLEMSFMKNSLKNLIIKMKSWDFTQCNQVL